MTAATPEQARPLDLPAMAAYATHNDVDAVQAARDWAQYSEMVRAHWRAVADAAITAASLAAPDHAALLGERDSLQRSCQLLAGVLVSQARTLYCAWIEASRGDLPAMREWVLNGIPDADDNDPADQWNGTETADEWFERTQDDGDAPKPQAQAVSSLRALLDQSTSLLWDTGMPGNRQAAGELRASGGLEAL